MATDTSGWKADSRDLPSLGTLQARAFHPKSEWHRKAFPSSIAPWWERKYALDLDDPTYRLLKIPAPDSPTTVIGLLVLRKFEAGERGAGRWSNFPPPPEVDRAAFDAMVNSMIKYRERFMIGQTHFCVDHFAVDAEYQGRGLGTTLMERACEVADREELDMFVEANEFAESFYHKFGFKTQEKVEMPGDLTGCFLIRKFG